MSDGRQSVTEQDERKVSETECIQNGGQNRGEPHDPADDEGSFDRQHFSAKRVGPARIGKLRCHFRKAERRQQRDQPVESECQNRRRAGSGECDSGECQDAATHDRADPHARRGKQSDVSFVHEGLCSRPRVILIVSAFCQPITVRQ